MISGNVPQHLVVGARTGFLTSIVNKPMPWQRIANQINMDAKDGELVDLGAAPMPTEDAASQVQDFIEKSMKFKAKSWSLTVSISYDAVKDDKTDTLLTKCKGAGANFQRHLNQLVFKTLNDGDVAGNLCYDGLTFFNGSHIDAGAHYQTGQDNVSSLALSMDNFETVLVASQGFKDDQGQNTDYEYDLLVVPPAYKRIAAQICGNASAYDTANNEVNPYNGEISSLVNSQLDSTAWILVASSMPVKPIIVAMREQPSLQEAWFDPTAKDGGMYYFKFYARYNTIYGDWRLAHMGHS